MEPKEHDHVTFPSGAQRSDREGEGRYDLVSPYGLRRLAIQYEEGSKHHEDERNWELGFPISRVLCSAIGHLNLHMMGDRSEDHLAAASWQLFAAMHFEELIEQGKLPVVLNDIAFDANTLPPDTGDVEFMAAVENEPPTDELRKVTDWQKFDVVVQVDLPVGAGVWTDPAIYEAIVQGQMRGEIVKIDGKFILQERKE